MIDADGCRAFLVRRLHPGGGRCPHCGVSLDGRQAESFAAGGRIRCNSCKRWSTWRTGTLFHRAALDERQLFLLLMLTSLHCSIDDISAVCRLSPDDAYHWQHRISEACH
ncbi:MAG: transposase [Desulfuromonadales bacterium]|nr:transposase [Desulfuromonadales bacterium]